MTPDFELLQFRLWNAVSKMLAWFALEQTRRLVPPVLQKQGRLLSSSFIPSFFSSQDTSNKKGLTVNHDATFEIKIALIGYVSVGKTTVLNALFREKFSEVSMRRTTAGVSNFRVHVRRDSGGDGSSPIGNPKDAKSTLEEITADNQRLRQEDAEVEQKTFDIELDNPLCEMREDTILTVVDVPGINEAGTSSKYKKFVEDNWYGFDCAVVVTDARQGVNTEEQMNLLHFVKTNLETIKDLPVIVLCNKVDEPDDEEQQVLVKEAREAVEQIFGVNDRKVALQQLLNEKLKPESRSLFPAFISVSAINAFIYQSGSRLKLEEFAKLDTGLVEKLGRERYGKAWRRMSKEEKIKSAFVAVNDKIQYQEGLEDSNFDKFLSTLALCVGGNETQGVLLERQLEIALSRLSPMGNVVSDLRTIFQQCQALGKPTDHLPSRFWELYEKSKHTAATSFSASPCNIASLAIPMNHLISFFELSQEIGRDAKAEVRDAGKKLIRVQVAELMQQWDAFRASNWNFDNSKDAAWTAVSKEDWETTIGSLLLVAGNRHVATHLGREKLMLENIRLEQMSTAIDGKKFCSSCSNELSNHNYQNELRVCRNCYRIYHGAQKPKKINCPRRSDRPMELTAANKYKSEYDSQTWTLLPDKIRVRLLNGEWAPVDQEYYEAVIRFEVPIDGPQNPMHFGHLMYQFCHLMDKIEN